MAKHFVAVCMVCLLCADHLPCSEHIIGNGIIGGDSLGSAGAMKGPNLESYNKQFNQRTENGFIAKPRSRRKRHSTHSSEDSEAAVPPINENSKQYLAKIFERFGDGDGMDLNGFESMLEYLGLTKFIVDRTQAPHEAISNGEDVTSSGGNTCMSSLDLVTRMSPNAYRTVYRHNPDLLRLSKREVSSAAMSNTGTTTTNELVNKLRHPSDNLNTSSDSNWAATGTDLAATSKERPNDTSKSDWIGDAIRLGSEELWNICPILLHQLVATNRSEDGGGCLLPDSISLPLVDFDSHDDDHVIIGADRKLVWLYASLSILGVSLCGLLGVAVIPCMEKKFYHQVLQFLVALAVGTLAGDALLHLLPHAMMLSMEAAGPNLDDMHTGMTMKGLVAVLAVVAFFLTERTLTMVAEWRKQRQKKQKLPSRVRVMRDPESQSLNNAEKLCKNKYSSYPYCYDEIAMDTKDDHHQHHHHHNDHEKGVAQTISTTGDVAVGHVYKQNSILPAAGPKMKTEDGHLSFDHSHTNHHHHQHHNHLHHPHSVAAIGGTTNGIMSANNNCRLNHNQNGGGDNNTMSTTVEGDTSSIESSKMLKQPSHQHEESYTVILREHESKHHGHSHTHGHVHSPPGSLSAVAWMVVMGDGLHNFTDGMAIGAAFSNDIAGGFSTAIAVFCHELPHELGDFAVLLKAGMSARQAVYYNLLSSILSFFGMVLGVAIGDTPAASAWIFAIAAGLFIYIALVDMVPELTSSHQMRSAASNTFLQVLGMLIGLSIMLLIALNEHDLKRLFSEDAHHHHHH